MTTSHEKSARANTADAAVITLPDLLAPVLERVWIVAAVAFGAGVLFFALSYLIKPVYETSATIAPANQGNVVMTDGSSMLGQFGGLLGLGSLGQSEFVRDSVGVLRSDALVARFINEKELLFTIFDYDPSDPANKDDVPTLAEGIKHFKSSVLSINEDKLSGLIIVSMRWSNAETAVEWTNAFVDLANESLRERTRHSAELANEFLAKELETNSSLELRQAIYGLMESNIKMIMLANTQEDFAFSVLDPALVPAEDDYVWPNRAVIAMLGLVLGGGGVAALLIWRSMRRTRFVDED